MKIFGIFSKNLQIIPLKFNFILEVIVYLCNSIVSYQFVSFAVKFVLGQAKLEGGSGIVCPYSVQCIPSLVQYDLACFLFPQRGEDEQLNNWPSYHVQAKCFFEFLIPYLTTFLRPQ